MGSHANVFSELRFGSWNCNICEFTLSPDVHLALCSVKKLTIDHLSLSSNQSDDVRKFSFRLSQWFPHLQELNIVSYQPNVARQIEFFLNYFTNLRAHQIVTTAKPAILSGRFYRPPVPVPLYEIIDFPAQFQRRGDRGVRGGGFAGGLRFPAVLNPAWYRVEEEVNEAGNGANVDNLVGANLDGDGANQVGDIEEAQERGEFAIEEAPLALDEMLIREVPAAEVHQREEIVGGGLQALRRPLLVHIRRRNGGDLVGNGQQEDEDEEVDLVDLDDDEEEDDEDDEEEMRMGREVVDLPPWHEDSREEMEDDYCDWVNDVEISSDEDFGS